MTAQRLRRGNWSVQELERLRQLLPRRGVLDTAALLRRSAASVQRKALELLRVPARRGAWTSSDDDRLRESWGAVELRLLAPMLGRPVSDVLRRAQDLRGAAAGRPWSRQDLATLKDLYGTRREEDLEVCLSRPAAEIVAMAARLCLAKDKRFAAHAQVSQAGVSTKPGPRMPRWRPAEVELLRQTYADQDNLAIARRLGRTVTSVANKASQLGLHKSPRLLADIGRNNVGLRHGSVPPVAADELGDGASG